MAESDEQGMATEATGGIQSLDAALRVLLAMGEMKGAVGLSELARACHMPASKVHRYLASFIHAGLVRQNGRSGTYDLGPRAIDLGLAALGRHDFVNSVAEGMPELTAQTGLTSLLCVWGNSGPTVVRWERAASFIVTSLGLGTTLPLLTSATGRVCLAYLPAQVTERLLEAELERATASPRIFDGHLPDRSAIATLTGDIRHRGYATVDGRFIPGLVAMAAPILDWQGQAQAVVTLIGADPASIAEGSRVLSALKTFCARGSVPSGKTGIV